MPAKCEQAFKRLRRTAGYLCLAINSRPMANFNVSRRLPLNNPDCLDDFFSNDSRWPIATESWQLNHAVKSIRIVGGIGIHQIKHTGRRGIGAHIDPIRQVG
jgi:hypothetical protein